MEFFGRDVLSLPGNGISNFGCSTQRAIHPGHGSRPSRERTMLDTAVEWPNSKLTKPCTVPREVNAFLLSGCWIRRRSPILAELETQKIGPQRLETLHSEEILFIYSAFDQTICMETSEMLRPATSHPSVIEHLTATSALTLGARGAIGGPCGQSPRWCLSIASCRSVSLTTSTILAWSASSTPLGARYMRGPFCLGGRRN